MPNEFIRQRIHDVNIEKYPQSFEPHQGSLTVGDLHGNPVKLLYSLIRHNAFKFKEGIDPEQAYDEFVTLYNESGNITTINGNNQEEIGSKIRSLEISIQRAVEGNKTSTSFPPLSILLEKIGTSSADLSSEGVAHINKLIDEKIQQVIPAESTLATEIASLNLKLKENSDDPLVTEWTEKLEILTDLQKAQIRIASVSKDQAEVAVQKENIEKLNAQVKANFPAIIDRFNAFLDKLEVDRKPGLIRLIGDELADRGKNDYFMLAFMNYLKKKDVNFKITISNHSNEFITFNEGVQSDVVSSYDRPSLAGLKLLLDNGIVSKATMDGWVNNAYTPNLKAIDYQLADGNPPTIRLFTHAPVRFDIIEKIANKLGVGYQEGTANALAQTIDSINAALAEHIQAGTIHTLCTISPDIDPAGLSPQEIEAHPLVYLIWNRWNPTVDQDETARPAEMKGFFDVTRYNLEYYHGHDGAFSKSPHVFNLDNGIGKNKVSDDVLMEQLKGAEEELEKSERQLVNIDTKLASGELTQEAADTQKQHVQKNINIYRAAIDAFHYTAFSADTNGLAAPTRSFVDRIPGFNAVRAFFADVSKAIAPNNATTTALLPQRRTVNVTDVHDSTHQDTKSESAVNLVVKQTTAQKAQGWFNAAVGTMANTARQFASVVREQVLSRTDPNYKAKQEFSAAMVLISTDVGQYNVAKDELKLYEGGARKYTVEEVKAYMQKMIAAAANLKKMEIPAGVDDIAKKYQGDPNTNNRNLWSNYQDGMRIRRGADSYDALFDRIGVKLKGQLDVEQLLAQETAKQQHVDTPMRHTSQNEPAENLAAQQTMAQKAQGWFNVAIATISKTAKQFASAVREEVLSRTDPDYKAKQEFSEAMIHINREVGKYNAAADRLKLYVGGAHKRSVEEVNADMQIMTAAVANLKKLEIPARAEDIAEHYKLDAKNKIGWSNYKECMMIRDGIKTPENLFKDIREKLNPQPYAHAWPKSQSHEHHTLAVNNHSVAENKVLTQESKKKLHDDLPREQGEIDTEREGQRQHL